MRPFLSSCAANPWELLAGRPAADDVDSRLGLHSYRVLLTLRTAKMEAFSNCFYGVDALKDGAFGSVRVQGRCAVLQAAAVGETEAAASKKGSGKITAEVAHFEVLPPHESGSRPPYPCIRQTQLVFQTLAFRTVLPDALFADVSVFDEHGHVFWAVSAAVALQSELPPHESAFSAQRFATIDFDRAGPDKGAAVRWICLADCGAAQLVMQLEYSACTAAGWAGEERPLPRLNTVTWHPELCFLDSWWGSDYARRR